MLWVGGAPVAGPPPAFEDRRLCFGSTDIDCVRDQRGKVLKWVDPSANTLPRDIRAKSIWMDRPAMDQARSQIKMATMFGTLLRSPAVKVVAKSLKKDRAPTLAALRKRGPVLIIEFRDLIEMPTATALTVQSFLGEDTFPSPVWGAKAILNRGPECQPDLHIEQRTLAAWTRSQTSA